ncbi:MAG: hypothetical protein WCF81_00350 [Roseiarcus sp.]
MPRKYFALIRTLALEAHQSAQAKARQRADFVLSDAEKHIKIWQESLGWAAADLKMVLQDKSAEYHDWRASEEGRKKFWEHKVPGSAEYLNRQLNERLDGLANILPISLNTDLINLALLKKPEPTAAIFADMPKLTLLAAMDDVVEHNRQIDKLADALRGGVTSMPFLITSN